MNKTVAVDIDDTLYDFNALAREVVADVAKSTGDTQLIRAAYAPWTEWRTPADLLVGDIWGEIIGRCHTDEMIFEQIPFRGAYNVLWNIINSGYDILYISNRAESAYGATARWIEAHDFPHAGNYDPYDGAPLSERVSLVCTTSSKKPFMATCQYIIDDRPKTLVEFVYDYDWKNKYGSRENNPMQRKGFGLHRPYNEALADVPGIYLAPTWNLLEVYLIEKGIVSPVQV